ncbi:DUF4097 family beta strand repeat-containing protein [Tissierella praeacuta]|uniref:DUF4097 family beta strand repeat-containing protein n=1 Tax=Tissierella praeacuta TaxID=43131 RepID=UPI003342BAF3
MKEEKMMILSMLEEGKITAEDAIKLMEALEDIEIPKNHNETKEEIYDDFQEKKSSKPIFNTLEDIGSDISNVLSNMFDGLKDVGNSFIFRNNYETITTDLDVDISNMNLPTLDLKAINGSIFLRPNIDNNLFIKVTCQYKKGLFSPDEPYFDFSTNENKIIFNPKYNSNISIKLDVSLPKKDYDEITLNSSNGKIDIQELNTDILKCITTNSSINIVKANSKEIDLTTKNGKIECKDINSNIIKSTTTNSSIFLTNLHCLEIEAKTANGKIVINNIDGQKIILKTSNALIETEDVNCNIIHLTTSNGKIICNNIDMNKAKEVKLMTSNGSINSKVYGITKDNYFDLETSMGNISLGIPNLVYKINNQANLGFKKIVAHNVNFDENRDNVKFIASTSNGSINIY